MLLKLFVSCLLMALPVDVVRRLAGELSSVDVAVGLAGELFSVDVMEGLVGGLASAGDSDDGLSERR